MWKKVILIKLGGGLIAPKEWTEETADTETIISLVEEIKESEKRVLVVSGSGNFGHKAVKKYGIDTKEGVEKVRESAKKIGQIVWQEMKNAGFEGELVEPNQVFGVNERQWEVDKTLVMYGDVVEESGEKWVIYSGEVIIEKLCGMMPVEKIIQVSKEDGVWDRNKKIIPEINEDNWITIKRQVSGSEGIDVTGGMLHKVEESLGIAKRYGVKTRIISGKVEGNLKKALMGENVLGTRIG